MPTIKRHVRGDARPAIQESFFRAVARTVKSYRLGDLLLNSGLITREQLDLALAEQAQTGGKLGEVLVRRGTVSAVALYRKLAEQWCLKMSAAGIAVVIQATTPSIAQAQDIDSTVARIQFTLAASPAPAVQLPLPKNGVFGATEVRSNDLSAFKKWTSAMRRFEEQLKTLSKPSPRMMMWRAEIQRLKGQSQRDQVHAVNDFMNAIPYIEDSDNYGKRDYWATPVEFLSKGGDCEDFAIAKYASLRALGFSAQQLRIAIVKDEVKRIPHAVLVVFTDDGESLLLDNQNKNVRQTVSVDRYTPIFSLNSTSWWLHRA